MEKEIALRAYERGPREPRPLKMQRGFQTFAEGSVLIETGMTRVLCSATVEEKVPAFLKDTGRGWVTAEYGMLPRSTNTRIPRERAASGGRTLEIQRLIGRALRATIDLHALGSRTITLDCDVLHADGGTRTAAITGAMVALADACLWLQRRGTISRFPIHSLVAAISVGIIDGSPYLDLDYREDSSADVDMNVAMLSSGRFVEVQGTGEREAYDRSQLNSMLDLAVFGIQGLFDQQAAVLEEVREFINFGNPSLASGV